MKKETAVEIAGRNGSVDPLQTVLDIPEAPNGESLDKKISEAIRFLQQRERSGLTDMMVNLMAAEQKGCEIKNAFWNMGEIIHASSEIELRKVRDADREKFLEVRSSYLPRNFFMKEEAYQAMLWNEHTQATALMLSVFQNDDCIGYCGIHNVTHEVWEIAIELRSGKTNQGIGTLATTAMLNVINERLDRVDYRVRIESGNYASQRLFEKLGAVPYGISKHVIYDPQLPDESEENHRHLIDDDLIAVEKKFSVAPKKLLCHALEYSLKWE